MKTNIHIHIVLLLSIPLIFIKYAYSQSENTKLFTGGMFIHMGYITNGRATANINGITTGLGGKLAFYTGHHFRIGSEGYSSTYNYEDGKGFYKLGWGGIVTEYYYRKNNTAFSVGLTTGGGRVQDLYLTQGHTTDRNEDTVIYEKQSVLLLTPSTSIEYLLSEKIRLACKVDYIFSPSDKDKTVIASGPRIYIGVHFSH